MSKHIRNKWACYQTNSYVYSYELKYVIKVMHVYLGLPDFFCTINNSLIHFYLNEDMIVFFFF